MKHLHFLLALAMLAGACASMGKNSSKKLSGKGLYDDLMNNAAGYDSIFAQKLGADTYGMKQYVMAFLKRGPKRDQDSATVATIQKGHLQNIQRLAAEGKLVLAGPFMDKGDIRGIFIFNVPTIEEARKLTETDPAIQSGRLEMELHPWYGTAVLPVIAPLAKRVEKSNVAD